MFFSLLRSPLDTCLGQDNLLLLVETPKRQCQSGYVSPRYSPRRPLGSPSTFLVKTPRVLLEHNKFCQSLSLSRSLSKQVSACLLSFFLSFSSFSLSHFFCFSFDFSFFPLCFPQRALPGFSCQISRIGHSGNNSSE